MSLAGANVGDIHRPQELALGINPDHTAAADADYNVTVAMALVARETAGRKLEIAQVKRSLLA